ncbi:MAG: CBS domain-containing protein, partial [Nitrososphaeraceae archaeon]
MQTNNFRRLPVVNKERKLVGIITDKDIFKVILTNEELLSNISNDKNFQLPASILENYRGEIFKDIS